LLVDSSNFSLTRQEDQDATSLLINGIETSLHHARLYKLPWLIGTPPHGCYWVHATFTRHDRCIIEQAGQTLTIERRRHHEHFEWLLITKQLSSAQGERKGQISIQVSGVKFIEDDQAHPFERRIVLEPARQDPLGDNFDSRVRTNLALQTNAVAHRLAYSLTKFRRQALSCSARRKPPRLEHENSLVS